MATPHQPPGTHLFSEIKRVIAPDAAVQNDDVVPFVGHAFQEGKPSCELHGLVWAAQPAAGKLPGRPQVITLRQAAFAAILWSMGASWTNAPAPAPKRHYSWKLYRAHAGLTYVLTL